MTEIKGKVGGIKAKGIDQYGGYPKQKFIVSKENDEFVYYAMEMIDRERPYHEDIARYFGVESGGRVIGGGLVNIYPDYQSEDSSKIVNLNYRSSKYGAVDPEVLVGIAETVLEKYQEMFGPEIKSIQIEPDKRLDWISWNSLEGYVSKEGEKNGKNKKNWKKSFISTSNSC